MVCYGCYVVLCGDMWRCVALSGVVAKFAVTWSYVALCRLIWRHVSLCDVL